MGWGVGSDPITPFHDGGSKREGTQLDFWRGRCISEHEDRFCGSPGIDTPVIAFTFQNKIEPRSLGTSLLRAVCCGPEQMGQNRARQDALIKEGRKGPTLPS